MRAVTIETLKDSTLVRADGSTHVVPAALQLVPQASISVATTLTDKELVNVVRHEYQEQQLTPAMAELLRRNGY